ncbi:MAG: hypothetical protein IPJ75_12235 [Ignavibacteriales bacterium]|nr:hypothetical protein [Ignavibacteriales bacterium]
MLIFLNTKGCPSQCHRFPVNHFGGSLTSVAIAAGATLLAVILFLL